MDTEIGLVAELVDATDLKSVGLYARVGSNPTLVTLGVYSVSSSGADCKSVVLRARVVQLHQLPQMASWRNW